MVAEEIGLGNFSKVYSATYKKKVNNSETIEFVALKVAPVEFKKFPDFYALITRECHLL